MEKGLALKTVSDNLKTLMQDKMEALPENFNQTRFLQNCLTVLAETKGIESLEPRSVARTMLKGAFLGLDFFNRECYAIPYGNQLQFQTDYKGEIKLAKKYSINKVRDIYAKLVREGDIFEEYVRDGQQHVDFKPLMLNDAKIMGAFAVVYYADGSMMYDSMSLADMENTRRKFSKQPDGKAWKDTPGEMYKKTVLRRLCKMIQLDFDQSVQDQAWREGSGTVIDVEGKVAKKEATDPFNPKPKVEAPKEEKPAEEPPLHSWHPEPPPEKPDYEKSAWAEEDKAAEKGEKK